MSVQNVVKWPFSVVGPERPCDNCGCAQFERADVTGAPWRCQKCGNAVSRNEVEHYVKSQQNVENDAPVGD